MKINVAAVQRLSPAERRELLHLLVDLSETARLSDQMTAVVKMAKDAGWDDAVRFIVRVYGGMEDPLMVSQQIRGRS